MKRMLAALGLVGLLGTGCPIDDDRLEGNGTGTPDDPVYVVTGESDPSLMLQGVGNPVGYSTWNADNSQFSTEYAMIGFFDEGGVIVIPESSEVGDHWTQGVGTYELLDNGEGLTEENAPFYFVESDFQNCPSGQDECIPICDNGQIWGDYLNNKLEGSEGFLILHTREAESVPTWMYTAFTLEGPWEGRDAARETETSDYSGDCSNIEY
jgi:hypothetical protein